MLNFIWFFFILISVIYSCFYGNIVEVNSSIYVSIKNTVELCLSLVGNICFWCGIINIIENTSIQKKLKIVISPLNKFLFPKVNQTSKAYENISLNMISNLLGIGNAATPAGLEAIEELKKTENKTNDNKLDDTTLMFIAINTASLQLIPTNVISIRNSLNSANPGSIIVGVWFSSIITFCFIVCMVKIYCKIRK